MASNEPDTSASIHELFLKCAVIEGEKGRLMTAPNPWVGCVITSTKPSELLKGGEPLKGAPDEITIVGIGHHSGPGHAHAEVEAFNCADANPFFDKDYSNCTLYTTLEPCHAGPNKRTGACDELIVKKGVKTVVVGIVDPDTNYGVNKGIEFLEQNGVEVLPAPNKKTADLVAESFKSYIFHRENGRPYVVCKAACSMDGKICCADKSSQWITQAKARADGHLRLRCASQCILVGSGTYIKDEPKLNVRLNDEQQKRIENGCAIKEYDQRARVGSCGAADGEMLGMITTQLMARYDYEFFGHEGFEARSSNATKQFFKWKKDTYDKQLYEERAAKGIKPYYNPQRVVLDRSGRLSKQYSKLTDGEKPWLVYAKEWENEVENANWRDLSALSDMLVASKEAEKDKSFSDGSKALPEIELNAILKDLGSGGCLQVLVEGGSNVQSQFFKYDLVDEICLYKGATMLGGSAVGWSDGCDLTNNIGDAKFWKLQEVVQMDDDVLLRYVKKKHLAS